MSDLLVFALSALGVAALAWLVWWLVIESEGVYLGRRAVIALYDLYAGRYDNIKGFKREYDHMFLSQPILQQIVPDKAPLILDVATGTTRLPLAMMNHVQFEGAVFGVDLSRRMLARGAHKLNGHLEGQRAAPPYAALVHAPAEHLPFPDDSFDVVTCLEALEFMERPEAVVRELARVLRPGGLILTTRRISTRLMPGKTWSDEHMAEVLLDADFDNVYFDEWQEDYTLVWGEKMVNDGDAEPRPIGVRPLTAVLRCPICGAVAFQHEADALRCGQCGARVPVGSDGVIEVMNVARA